MIGKLAISRKNILFSAALLCLSLGTFFYAAIVYRWPDSLATLPIDLIGFLLWLVWIFHLGWMLFTRPSEHRGWKRYLAEFFGAILGSMVLFLLVEGIGNFVVNELQLHDIRIAVNAGLRNDCINLLHNWPVTNDVIDMDDPSFAKLPQSIQMLGPLNVYNDKIEDTNIPPNIGVCMDGLGGMFYGVRVFQNDDDAKKLEASYGDRIYAFERVAPGVYLWKDQE
jgi:hypothetical protein